MLCLFKFLFPLFQWHACELAKLSTCIAKCMTTLNRIYIFTFTFAWEVQGMDILKSNAKFHLVSPESIF